MVKAFKSINRYLFYYGETLNIAIVFYFSRVLGNHFCAFYIAILLILLLLKNTLLSDAEKYADKISILPISIFLMEFSITFLTYTNIPVKSEIIVTSLGFAVIYYFVLKQTVNLNQYSNVMISALLLCLVAVIVLRRPTWIIEVSKLFFIVFSIYVMRYKHNVFWIIIPLIISSGILIAFADEFGSVMVLCIAFAGMCIFSENKAAIGLSILIIAVVVIVWFYILKTKGIYQWVSDSTDGGTKVSLKRLFFDYSDDDQIVMLRSIISNRNWFDKLSTMIAPPEYVEIVSYENNSTTSSADYLYSVMMYSFGQVYSFILVASNISILFYSIAKHINSELKVIPLLLLSQTMVHILGNCIIFPFTGITYPFLSHGGASLLCNIIMLCILSYNEINE